MDPSWTDQMFVFDVPVLPSDSIRGNSVRINVKTKNILGDNWVGQADIQLASLVNENVMTGWFPLRPHKSAIAGAPYDELQHNGSIKLRVEWVHSNEALKKHLKTAIKRYGIFFNFKKKNVVLKLFLTDEETISLICWPILRSAWSVSYRAMPTYLRAASTIPQSL